MRSIFLTLLADCLGFMVPAAVTIQTFAAVITGKVEAEIARADK